MRGPFEGTRCVHVKFRAPAGILRAAFPLEARVSFDLPLPFRSLVIGFTIAATVGPITLLVVRRTIEHGRVYGLASGLGVAAADATYGGIAAFGLTAVTSLLVSGRVLLGIVGGLVIIVIGVRIMRSKPPGAARDVERPGLLGAFASIYALTMTNPLTILIFAAVFAGLGFASGSSYADAVLITLGVGLGSVLWWLALTAGVAWSRERVSTRALLWVNRLSGAALVVFGAFAVIGVLRP
jgi:threonine/homoserine/homoserine lactone efflux protein